MIGLIYLTGFFASLLGLRRLRVAGEGFWADVLFRVQATLLSAAALQQLLESIGVRPDNWLFSITDAAWPFSHIFMCATGIAVLLARSWKGLRAWSPLLIGLAVPALVAVQAVANQQAGRVAFALATTAGFSLLGYSLCQCAKPGVETESLIAAYSSSSELNCL
jgi:hypothetical protein